MWARAGRSTGALTEITIVTLDHRVQGGFVDGPRPLMAIVGPIMAQVYRQASLFLIIVPARR